MSQQNVPKDEIENFVYYEMKLLDERRYQEWLNLFADDGVYWIPRWVSENNIVENPEDDLNVLYLDRKRLEIYIRRILTGMAYTYEPHPRTTRLVSNILIGEETQDYIQVLCKFIMNIFRAQPHELYGPRMLETLSGDIEYRLKRVDGKFKIKLKKVTVINEPIIGGQLYVI
ncbi:aromatic-ring-hydroxylating dioxygenase subunit beta [Sulfolobus tengchongensis]|uniref:Aromatic-ring-hydroxylating dioxygenase subunit beta n=1 Tax=Sulfolobus tengchongensis TaxID=207809 RepID=A0AAX4L3E5_9CREN